MVWHFLTSRDETRSRPCIRYHVCEKGSGCFYVPCLCNHIPSLHTFNLHFSSHAAYLLPLTSFSRLSPLLTSHFLPLASPSVDNVFRQPKRFHAFAQLRIRHVKMRRIDSMCVVPCLCNHMPSLHTIILSPPRFSSHVAHVVSSDVYISFHLTSHLSPLT